MRPTSDRVREAMFNIIGSRLEYEDAEVLDLFAGTGALGLEALSRGSENVIFVESNLIVLSYCRNNAEFLGVSERCTFLRMDSRTYLNQGKTTGFDLILADPPYDLRYLEDLPDLAMSRLKPSGLFVLEHDRRSRFSERSDLETSRTYGRTIVSVFSKAEQNE